MDTKEIYKIFQDHFDFWDKISEQQRIDFCNNTTAASYKKGQNIHGINRRCTGGIFVRRGIIRVYLMSDEGKEITLYRLYAGDICMLAASCVIKALTFDVYVDAEEESDVLTVNPSTFQNLSDTNIYVENFGLNVAVTRFSDVIWAIQQILFKSMDQRLAIFLYDEVVKNNSNIIKLTHEQIAKYTGSAREVISRMLKYFSDEGIVNLSRGTITIMNKEKLANFAR